MGITIMVFLSAAAPTPPPGPLPPSLLHTKYLQRKARARFEALSLILATYLANASRHIHASANKSCNLKPLRTTTNRTTNQIQSGFRMAFLHFMATRVRLRQIKRQGREAPNFQLKSVKATPTHNPTSTQPKHHQASAWHSFTLWPLCLAEEKSSVKVERSQTLNRTHNSTRIQSNAIRFLHGILTLYGHSGSPKKNWASKSTDFKLST